MKDKIKELMKQAGTDVSGKWMGVEHAEKFVELIVLECTYAVQDGTKEGDWYAQKIEEHFNDSPAGILHFGVEESKGWVCSKCGVDRTKAVCPKGHTAALTGECPMSATAQSGV